MGTLARNGLSRINLLGVTKGIKRLEQNTFGRLHFSAPTQRKSSDNIFINKSEQDKYLF